MRKLPSGEKRMPSKKSAFLDSSVFFSAVNSPTGGSAKLFTLKKIKLVTSRVVLTETERNVRKKLERYHLERFFMLVSKVDIIDQTPRALQIKKAERFIVKKDAVILAEAKQADIQILVTLDQKHFLIPRVRDFLKTKKVLTPKMLISSLEEN